MADYPPPPEAAYPPPPQPHPQAPTSGKAVAALVLGWIALGILALLMVAAVVFTLVFVIAAVA